MSNTVASDTITFTSSFGGSTSTSTDGIFLESGAFDIDLKCTFPMSYTLTATVATNPAVPVEYTGPASDAAIVSNDDNTSDKNALGKMKPEVAVSRWEDETFSVAASPGAVEIGTMYYYQIDAPMQMPIRKLKLSWAFQVVFRFPFRAFIPITPYKFGSIGYTV